MKTVAITGVTGTLGSAVGEKFASAGVANWLVRGCARLVGMKYSEQWNPANKVDGHWPCLISKVDIIDVLEVRSWFSSTPHTFELQPELGFEEVFYFRSMTPGAKALLEGEGLWPDGTPVDESWSVRDRQFAQVPMGRHRVALLPVEDKKRPGWWYWWAYLATKPEWEK